MKSIAVYSLFAVLSTVVVAEQTSDSGSTQLGRAASDIEGGSSRVTAVGHGPEVHLARKVDSQVGEELRKKNAPIAVEEHRRIATFAPMRRRISKRSPFFNDDDFAVFSHPTYDADVDSDSTFYEEKSVGDDTQDGQSSPFASERRRMRRRVARSVGHGSSGGGGAVKATTANRMNGWHSKYGHKAAGHHKGARRTGGGGHRRVPDTSGWGSCPPCCTWPSSWQTSCRPFYNCFSC